MENNDFQQPENDKNVDFTNLHNFDIKDDNEDDRNSKKKFSYDSQNISKLLTYEFKHPLYLSVSEAAKISGVGTKTIRRALQSNKIPYKIVKERYQLDFVSVIQYMHSNKKLKNKLYQKGLGQFIDKWKR